MNIVRKIIFTTELNLFSQELSEPELHVIRAAADEKFQQYPSLVTGYILH